MFVLHRVVVVGIVMIISVVVINCVIIVFNVVVDDEFGAYACC